METFALLVGPIDPALLALPFVAGEGEKLAPAPGGRLHDLIVGISVAVFTRLAIRPFSPVMQAWSGAPVPVGSSKDRPPGAAGRGSVQLKQCRSYHALGFEGGARGPALDEVAIRLTRIS